jgi:hypothetical protein
MCFSYHRPAAHPTRSSAPPNARASATPACVLGSSSTHSFPAEPAAGLMHSQLAHSAAQYRGARQRRGAWVARQSGWQAAFAATSRLGSPRSHMHRDPSRICIGTGLAPPAFAPVLGLIAATSAPGLDSSLPHLHRDWAHRCHICTGTGAHRCHICTGTGLNAATSAPGLGSPLPHLHRDRAQCCHICTRTGLTPRAAAPADRQLVPRRRRTSTCCTMARRRCSRSAIRASQSCKGGRARVAAAAHCGNGGPLLCRLRQLRAS